MIFNYINIIFNEFTNKIIECLNWYEFLFFKLTYMINMFHNILNYWLINTDHTAAISFYNLSYIFNENTIDMVEVDLISDQISSIESFISNGLIFILQANFFIILSVWARAAGPRYRIDQILHFTWKDYFLILNFILVFNIFIFVIL